MFSRVAAWWCLHRRCKAASSRPTASAGCYPDPLCLPWLQFTWSLCQSKSQWFGTWPQPVEWQLWCLRALVTLRDNLLLLPDNTNAVVICRIPGNPKFCLGRLCSQCRCRVPVLQTDGADTAVTAAGAPPGVMEMGFGGGLQADPAYTDLTWGSQNWRYGGD